MASSMSVTFHGISRLKFKAIRARIRAQAVKTSVLGDTGSASDGTLTYEWVYCEDEQKLTMTCTKRPWWKSEAFVESRIRGLVEAL
jgi:hypothetical protein